MMKIKQVVVMVVMIMMTVSLQKNLFCLADYILYGPLSFAQALLEN
jgi:hypothetical protein